MVYRPSSARGGSIRTFRYSREHPEGVIFDTEPHMKDPHLPSNWKSAGWVEHRSDLQMTADQVIEAAVKNELAKQSKDRVELEREVEKKTGEKASSLISDEAMERTYDAPVRRRGWQRHKT